MRGPDGDGNVSPFPLFIFKWCKDSELTFFFPLSTCGVCATIDGMFAVLVPVTVSPLIASLFWAERKAKKMGIVPEEEDEEPTGMMLICYRFACLRTDVFGFG